MEGVGLVFSKRSCPGKCAEAPRKKKESARRHVQCDSELPGSFFLKIRVPFISYGWDTGHVRVQQKGPEACGPTQMQKGPRNTENYIEAPGGPCIWPPSFQLIFQILPEATLRQLLPESRF
jgi:hypothetical protein